MTISVFELFKVGVGPSSSHTVGPMRAAAHFVADLDGIGVLARVADVRVELYGSLAATGRGHGTLPAVLLGLEGYRPETIKTEEMESGRERLRSSGKIMLGGRVPIALCEDDIALHARTVLDYHPNGMTSLPTAPTTERCIGRPTSPLGADSSSQKARLPPNRSSPTMTTHRSRRPQNCSRSLRARAGRSAR